LSSHYELAGQTIPECVAKAVKGIKAVSEKHWNKSKGATDPYHACFGYLATRWRGLLIKGHAAGVRRKASAEGKFRVDLSLK